MSFALLCVVAALASVAAVYLALTVALLPLRPPRVATAAARADVLLLRAVAPTLLGLSAALGIVLPAFVLFEPRHDGERVGPIVLVLAALGAAHLVRIGSRVIRMLAASRRVTGPWRREAWPLTAPDWERRALAMDAGFPVVAVAGFLRQTLFVDARVIAACGAAELAAIAAHEEAHVRRRDNLRRLLLGACAGPHSTTAAAWREAAEEAADDQAGCTPQRRIDLASALLKVARLAPGRSFEAAALSTIHDGPLLERRIRRLLDTVAPRPGVSVVGLAAAAWFGAAALAAVYAASLLSSAHALAEHAVQYLR